MKGKILFRRSCDENRRQSADKIRFNVHKRDESLLGNLHTEIFLHIQTLSVPLQICTGIQEVTEVSSDAKEFHEERNPKAEEGANE